MGAIFAQFFFQFAEFNRHTESLLLDLLSTPEVKDLPAQIERMEVEMAQFGSRLTEMDTNMRKTKDKVCVRRNLAQSQKVLTSSSSSLRLWVTFQNRESPADVGDLKQLRDGEKKLREDVDSLNSQVMQIKSDLETKLEDHMSKYTHLVSEKGSRVRDGHSSSVVAETLGSAVQRSPERQRRREGGRPGVGQARRERLNWPARAFTHLLTSS